MGSIDWSLAWRMVVSVVLLSFLTLGLAGGLFVIGFLFALLGTADLQLAVVGGLVASVGLLTVLAYLEYRQIDSVEELADARPADAEEFPHLHALVARVASQLGVPTPTIALSERDVPEAMVVGVRPSETTLILSYGTLGALDDAELEAVVAHELAHVRNRDAAVMTVLSMPAVLAAGIREYFREPEEPEDDTDYYPESAEPEPYGASETFTVDGEIAADGEDDEDDGDSNVVVRLAFLAVATVTLVCSRAVIALLSRARERTADRTAALTTGQPSDLASALRTLDRRIAETPASDLRSTASVSSLSVLPLEPAVAADVGLDRETERGRAVSADGSPAGGGRQSGERPNSGRRSDRGRTARRQTDDHRTAHTPAWQRFQTHPSTADRLRQLREIEDELS